MMQQKEPRKLIYERLCYFVASHDVYNIFKLQKHDMYRLYRLFEKKRHYKYCFRLNSSKRCFFFQATVSLSQTRNTGEQLHITIAAPPLPDHA